MVKGQISDSTFEVGEDNEFLNMKSSWAEQMETFRDKLVEAYIRGIQLSKKEIHEITALEPKTEP